MNEQQRKRYEQGRVFWCTRCVVPSNYAIGVEFDEEGVCTGCRMAEEHYQQIDWEARKKALLKLIEPYRRSDGYDCIIPVSGGKDSYYQTHIVTKELGLRPLLVTFHGGNYLPEAQENLDRMKTVFDVDHHIFHIGMQAAAKLHRLGLEKTGDMSWYVHCGIFTYPIQVAVKEHIPLLFWGEPFGVYRNGMYSYHDLIEFTRKYRTEHAQRGYDWNDFVADGREQLTEKEMLWAKYPSDEEIDRVGVRGIYLGNYYEWEQHTIAERMAACYGWQAKRTPYLRTHRNFDGIDDMHEIGVHDWLKYLKFGYGRCTDACSLDIRSGRLTRDRALELVARHDPAYPAEDLPRWLELTGYTKDQFDASCDKWRNLKVWRKNAAGQWQCDHPWDYPNNEL
jgi:N-acetyl sugar amidotransferase